MIASDIAAVARKKISESWATDEVAEVERRTARAVVTVTMLEAVAVLFDALAPVVIADVSVTVAVSVCAPEVVGLQLTVNGELPVVVPISVPLSKNCTETIVELPVGAAFTVTGTVAGEIADAIVDPLVGVTNDIVGVANAVDAANNAAAEAFTNRCR